MGEHAAFTLALSGTAGPYTVIADEALEELADKLAKGASAVRVRLGDLDGLAAVRSAAPAMLGGRQVIRGELELPDGFPAPVQPAPVSGADVTAADRAAQMPVLERQATQGNVQ